MQYENGRNVSLNHTAGFKKFSDLIISNNEEVGVSSVN